MFLLLLLFSIRPECFPASIAPNDGRAYSPTDFHLLH